MISVVLFPLGLILLIVRASKDRQINYTTGRTVRGVGRILLLITILSSVMAASEGSGDAVPGLIIIVGVPALIFLIIGNGSIKKGYVFGQYMDAIYNRNVRSMHQLAGMLNRTPGVVLNDIQVMMRKGIMPGARIQNYMIILPNEAANVINPQTQQNPNQAQQVTTNVPKPVEVVKVLRPAKSIQCKGCGSSTVIKDGEVKVCEFCGSNITYDM
jgi:hypothetical protein